MQKRNIILVKKKKNPFFQYIFKTKINERNLNIFVTLKKGFEVALK